MRTAAIGTVLRLLGYGSAVAGSAWLLAVARQDSFSWWWPLAVVGCSMAYAAVAGPCYAGRPRWRVSIAIQSALVAALAVASGWLTLTPTREAVAALCWLALLTAIAFVGREPREDTRSASPPTRDLRWHRLGVGSVFALVLAGAAAWLVRSSAQTEVALVLWAGAIVIVVWGSGRSAIYPEDHPARELPPVLVEFVILVAIVAVALALRLFGLGDVPVHIDGDEGRIGLQILETLRGVKQNSFDMGWNGFGQMAFMAQGVWMKVLEPGLDTLRMGSATAGAIGVLGLYIFLRELCGWRAAVIGAALLAVNPEHLAWSRAGMMNGQATTMVTLAMAVLAMALRRGRLVWWAVLGIALCGCLLTYHAAKAVLGVVAVVVVLEVVVHRRRWRSIAAGVVMAAIALLVAVLPHLPAVVDRWDWYSAEIGNRFDIHRLVDAVEAGDNQQVRHYLRRHVGSVIAVPVTCRQAGFVPAGGFLDPAAAVMAVGAPLWLLFWWRCRSARIVLVWIAVYVVSSGMLTFDPPWKPRLVMALPALVAAVAMAIDLSGRCGEDRRSRWSSLLPWFMAGLCVVGGLVEAWNRQVDPFSPGFVTSDPKSSLINTLRDLQREGWIGSDPVLLLGATNRHEANLYFSQRHGLLGVFDGLVDVGDDLSALPIIDPKGRRHLIIVAPRQEVLLSVVRAHYPEAPEERIPGQRGETMNTLVRLDEDRVRGSWGWQRLDGDSGPDEPVQRPPFKLESNQFGSWGGRLFVPIAGRLGLEVSGCDTAGIRIDGWPESKDTREILLKAAQGWHDVRVSARASNSPCSVELRWCSREAASWKPIPEWALSPEAGSLGLLLRLWRGSEWQADTASGRAPDLWRVDPVLSYDFDMVERQETLPAAFRNGQWLSRWDGMLRIPRTARWTMELEFDTAWAEVEVGDIRSRVDGPGVVRVEGPFAEGDHRFIVRTGADGQAPLRRLVVKLRWGADGEQLQAVPYGALAPPADLMIRSE